MIVQCPSCKARYKINEAKIRGRGAKITCLKCSHKFVVLRSQDEIAPAMPAAAPSASRDDTGHEDIRHRDFRDIDVTWKVRKGIGLTYEVHDLDTLLDYLEDEQVDPMDHLSYDSRNWDQIASIPDLAEHFRRVWDDVASGRINPNAPASGPIDEDEADAPTTIVRHGSSLREDIRRAVLESSQPPAEPRSAEPHGIDDELEAPAPALHPRNPQANHPLGHREPAPAPRERFTDLPPTPAPAPAPVAKPPPRREDANQSSSVVTLLLVAAAIVLLLILLGVALGWLPMPGTSTAALAPSSSVDQLALQFVAQLPTDIAG